MAKDIRKRVKKGQAIVEFSLLFPFFLLIVVGGIVDFGFAFFNFITLQQLTNNTAQYAATEGISDSQVKDFLNDRRPKWWLSDFSLQTGGGTPTGDAPSLRITTSLTSDGVGTVKQVELWFTSPAYTPFYQTMLSLVAAKGIRLSTLAAFQIAKNF